MNIFQRYPQFIESDIRNEVGHSYKINADFLNLRYSILLPQDLIKDKTILDLGCCVGAAGAWVLEHGAKSYCGVELQTDFANKSKENLNNSFPTMDWEIIESGFDNFFETNTTKFDIVIASGVVYASVEYQNFLNNISKIATNAIIIESHIPDFFYRCIPKKLTNRDPIVEYSRTAKHIFEDSSYIEGVWSAFPSMGAVELMLNKSGFQLDEESYNKSKILFPLGDRYVGIFLKKSISIDNSVEFLYKNKNKRIANSEIYTDEKTVISPTWKFDANIANIFGRHARQHIPDYDKVINLSVEVCKQLLANPQEDRIVDIGCATGETINRLFDNKFMNLVGVDNSQSMLDKCDANKAYYVLSDKLPIDSYNAVICNWTLHFIKDKLTYLQEIFDNLKTNGFLILTDKTSNSGVDLELYHAFKRRNGVTDEEIQLKENSLKDVMFVDSVEWYLNALADIGFNVSIINAAPCFTTFLAIKKS